MTLETDEESLPGSDSGGVRSHRGLWLLAFGLAICGLAAWQLSRAGSDPVSLSRAYGFNIGDFAAISEARSEPAPDLEGPALGGGNLALADHRGDVVVVNLWASWCGPCRREQPDLEQVWREYRDRGVRFLGVNVRDQRAAARAFQEEFGVTYPSFYDEASQLAHELKAQNLPTTYVIDRDGTIVLRLTGTIDDVLLREILDATLEGEPARG